MTLVREALSNIHRNLASCGIADSQLEAELLLMASLGKNRAALYASLSDPIAPDQGVALVQAMRRRTAREPIFHILGHREFFGLDIALAPGVFIPRPETELLVEEAIRTARDMYHGSCTLADVGTGSGAIAVALGMHLADSRIYATEKSPHSMEAAMANIRRYGLQKRVTLLRGDLLAPIPEPVDIVVANLPYVRSEEIATLEPEVRLYEPREALDGGPDGLSVIRRLLRQAPDKLLKGGALLLEIDPCQAVPLSQDLKRSLPGADITATQDWTGRERVIAARAVLH